MRLLLLAYALDSLGGVGSFNYELIKGLAKLGIDIIIIARNDPFNKEDLKSCAEIIIHKFPNINIPPKDVIFYFRNLRGISEIVKSAKADVIHDSSGAIGYMPWITKIAPTVVTVHGSPMLDRLRIAYGSFNDKLRLLLFKITHQLPSGILGLFGKPSISKLVFVSRSCLVDALIHQPPGFREELMKKSVVIYNGISLDPLQKFRDVETVYGRIAFLGRLVEYKGAYRLLKVFARVVKEIPEAELHYIGSGPQQRSLISAIEKYDLKEKVRFHGWLPRHHTLKVLKSSYMLVHPSLYEGFGYSIVEAYALGKPVVAHRAPYSIELVENTKAGITVNSFDERTMADVIIKLLTDSTLYKILAQNAIKAVKEYFNIEKTAKSYLKVYEEVIEKSC